MLRLEARGFDFRESFPVPRDDLLREAGRQGLLDQKEDPQSSDAQWVALQHCAWCDELRGYHVERAYLEACLEARVDPGTARPPRAAEAWPAIETRMRAELLRLDVMVSAILGNYADHFGCEAAEAFAAFVQAAVLAEGEVGLPQRSLFAG